MTFIRTGLAEEDVALGKRLWDELKSNSQFPALGMLWLLDGEWHLLIVSETVDEIGPRDAFRKLAEIAPVARIESSELLRVQLVGTKHPLYRALRAVFAKAASVEGVRLGGSQVGGIYVEDAYLYGIR